MNKKAVLSASQINKFINEPCLWAMQYFLKVYSRLDIDGRIIKDINSTGVRGTVVEDMLNTYLLDGRVQHKDEVIVNCCANCVGTGYSFTMADIDKMYQWGLYAINNFENHSYGELIDNQTKVEMQIEGVDLIGYIDLNFKDCIVDLKTINKLPNVVSRGERQGLIEIKKTDNVRQQLIYREWAKKPAWLHYINFNGDVLQYEVTARDYDEQWPVVINAVKEIKKLLTYDKIDDIVGIIKPVNTNSIFWDDNTRLIASKYWSI